MFVTCKKGVLFEDFITESNRDLHRAPPRVRVWNAPAPLAPVHQFVRSVVVKMTLDQRFPHSQMHMQAQGQLLTPEEGRRVTRRFGRV